MNLYWLIEVDKQSRPLRTLAAVGEDKNGFRSFRTLHTTQPLGRSAGGVAVTLDAPVVIGQRTFGLIPVVDVPHTDVVAEAVEWLGLRAEAAAVRLG